jgi:hypothetical protein
VTYTIAHPHLPELGTLLQLIATLQCSDTLCAHLGFVALCCPLSRPGAEVGDHSLQVSCQRGGGCVGDTQTREGPEAS